MHELDFRYQMARHFKCSVCGSTAAATDVLSFSGEHRKQLSQFDVFDMIVIGCKSCGQLQFFDKYFLPEKNIWDKPSES